MNKNIISKIAVAGLAIVVSSASSAATGTSSIPVTATVASQCTISATALNFGAYDPNQATDDTAASTISVTCSNQLPVTIALDAGTSTGATETARLMVLAGKPSMKYAIYSDAGRANNWGSSAGTQSTTGAGTNTPVVLNVYGSIPKNQYAVGVGAYSDSVTATVTY